MKTNTYLGLISLQLGATNIQHSLLAARQAERDAEQQQLTREANEVAQKAHYAQWRQTPEGQHFERWREAALDITALVRDRNDAWTAIREAILSIEIANVPEPSATDTDHRKPKRVYSVAAIALWVIVFILAGLSPDPDSPLDQVGIFFTACAIAATVLLIIPAMKVRKRQEEARNAAVRQAHDRVRVRYGESPSWHPEMALERIQDIALAIDDTIARGPHDFPSPRDLQPLLPVLATRTPEVFPADLPDEARQLLEVFARENQEKAARLEALRLA